MPRPPRLQIPQGTYHVTARRCASGPLFVDVHDRATFAAILNTVLRRYDWTCSSFCLMTTHYHLLVTTPNPNLASGMQRLNSLYARSFNRRQAVDGHVFKGRYHAELIQGEGHLLEVCRYIALNPVRAGLCVDPADWRWSSYRASVGLEKAPAFLTTSWLLGLFGKDPTVARARFRTFVAESASLQGLTP